MSLARFLALPAPELRLIVASAGRLAAIRVGLWVLPFRWIHGAVRRREDHARTPGRRPIPHPERVVWAVGVAGRLVPRATCLVRALAAQGLLARHGHASQLRLGVTRGTGPAFEAHAWLEHDGRVLIGGPVDGRYVPLPALDPVDESRPDAAPPGRARDTR
jgi:hypothetical protein